MSAAIKQMITELKAQKKEFEDKANDLLEKEFKEFFKAHPEVEALRWEQYSPFFNDGDECVFHVHGLHVKLADGTSANDDTDDDEGLREGWHSTYYDYPEQLHTAIQELDEILTSKEMEDLLYDIYGNHSQITVTKDEVTVDEYEHD